MRNLWDLEYNTVKKIVSCKFQTSTKNTSNIGRMYWLTLYVILIDIDAIPQEKD